VRAPFRRRRTRGRRPSARAQAVDFVRERLARGARPAAVCEALCDRCLAPDTEGSEGRGCDNMSAMVVALRGLSPLAAAAPGGAGVDLARLPPPPPDPDAAVVGARREVPPGRGASCALWCCGTGLTVCFCKRRPASRGAQLRCGAAGRG